MPPAPVVEVARLIGETVLDHRRILAAIVGKIGPRITCHPNRPGLFKALTRVNHRFTQTGRRHQLFKIVRRIDNHQHPRTGVPARSSSTL